MSKLILSIFLLCLQLAAATTYYVQPGGNNANTGLGVTTALAWQTITKALTSVSPAAGDTVIIAPGTYREILTLTRGFATTPLYVRGDPRNESRFTTVAGALIAPGFVRWTAHTTDDKTASAGNLITTAAGTTNYHFSDLWLDAGRNTAVRYCLSSAIQNNMAFVRCLFTGEAGMNAIPAADIPVNIHLTNCISAVANICVSVNAAGAPTALFDLDVDAVDCLHIAGGAFVTLTAEGGAFAFTGVNVIGNTSIGGTLFSYSENTATNSPATRIVVSYNIIQCINGINGAAANTTMTNTYNVYHCQTERVGAGVIAGPGETTSYIPLMEVGQSALWFRRLPVFGMPLANSPILNFCDDIAAGTGGTDLIGRMRPSGSGFWGAGAATNAVGALEVHDIGQPDTTVFDDGTTALRITGPGDHIVTIPVLPRATIISIRVRHDSNYTGTLPQVERAAQPELCNCDIPEVLTSVGAADTWTTLTFTSFTPLQNGVAYLYLKSLDTAGNGNAYFDRVLRNY